MALNTPAGTRFSLYSKEFPYTASVKHGLERFDQCYPWARNNLDVDSWRMYINDTHYVFCFKQQDDLVRFTLTCL